MSHTVRFKLYKNEEKMLMNVVNALKQLPPDPKIGSVTLENFCKKASMEAGLSIYRMAREEADAKLKTNVSSSGTKDVQRKKQTGTSDDNSGTDTKG